MSLHCPWVVESIQTVSKAECILDPAVKGAKVVVSAVPRCKLDERYLSCLTSASNIFILFLPSVLFFSFSTHSPPRLATQTPKT